MARSQVPWGVEALQGEAVAPAWKTKPSFYLVVTEDRMIPPPAQRRWLSAPAPRCARRPAAMRSSVSNPQVVADLIEQAA